MLAFLQRECLDLREAIERLSEKQDLLATLTENKKCLPKDAPERLQEQTSRESKQAQVRENWKTKGIEQGC